MPGRQLTYAEAYEVLLWVRGGGATAAQVAAAARLDRVRVEALLSKEERAGDAAFRTWLRALDPGPPVRFGGAERPVMPPALRARLVHPDRFREQHAARDECSDLGALLERAEVGSFEVGALHADRVERAARRFRPATFLAKLAAVTRKDRGEPDVVDLTMGDDDIYAAVVV